MTGIIKLKSDIEYDAIEITKHEGDRAVIARWLLDAGMIDGDTWSVETAKILADDFNKLEGKYALHHPTGAVAFVEAVDIATDFTRVSEEEELFDELDKQFEMPPLSKELRARGEFQTEEQWQMFEETESYPAGWYDAMDEDNAVKRTNASAKQYGTKPGVRVRTQIVVTGPWNER